MRQKLALILLTFTLSFSTWAQSLSIQGLPLAQSGDVLLLPMRCTLCQAIARETGSPYAHSGVLLQGPEGKWWVAQALGKVELISLDKFLSMAWPLGDYGHFRHHQLQKNPQLAKGLWSIFKTSFEGAPFDHAFLWDNFNQLGQEEYYCSEFVAKFLNQILPAPIAPAIMDFSLEWEFWLKYFSHYGVTVPQGKRGLAPADIEHSPDFMPVLQ